MAVKKQKLQQQQNREIITIDITRVPIYIRIHIIYYRVWHSYDNVYYIPSSGT